MIFSKGLANSVFLWSLFLNDEHSWIFLSHLLSSSTWSLHFTAKKRNHGSLGQCQMYKTTTTSAGIYLGIFNTSTSKWQLESENAKTGKCCSISMFFLFTWFTFSLKFKSDQCPRNTCFRVSGTKEIGRCRNSVKLLNPPPNQWKKIKLFWILLHILRKVYYKIAHLTVYKWRFCF